MKRFIAHAATRTASVRAVAVHINDLCSRSSRRISRSLTDAFFLPPHPEISVGCPPTSIPSLSCSTIFRNPRPICNRYTALKRAEIITAADVLQLRASERSQTQRKEEKKENKRRMSRNCF